TARQLTSGTTYGFSKTFVPSFHGIQLPPFLFGTCSKPGTVPAGPRILPRALQTWSVKSSLSIRRSLLPGDAFDKRVGLAGSRLCQRRKIEDADKLLDRSCSI